MKTADVARSYTFWWFFQRFSGVLLFLTLLTHIGMVHFNLMDFKAVGLRPEEVAQRYNDPFMKLFYALFLLMAVPHGLNGVLNAVDDYIRHDLARMAATWLTWAAGLVLLTWGMFTLV